MELQLVDGMAWVRKHPEKFFVFGVPSCPQLVGHILCDAVHLHVKCTVQRYDNYWIVSSNSDWLRHAEFSTKELFARIVPAPEQGANSMRGEVIVAAFASELATFDGELWLDIHGEISSSARECCEMLSNVTRLIVFRVSSQ